jgi:hypothetical protein
MTTTGLSRVDLEALERAHEQGCKVSAAYREHLEHIAHQSGWDEAAQSAAYYLQVKNLRLKCWECPPSSCRDSIEVINKLTYGSRAKEVKLRRRLLALNLSLFEPDPQRAIERAEAARRNARVAVGEKKVRVKVGHSGQIAQTDPAAVSREKPTTVV